MSMHEQQSEAAEREDWDEDDWEAFLRQADARTARYQELFETLIDHPSRDAIIAHEMGWDSFFSECRSKVENCDECPDRFECEAYEMLRLMEGPDNIDDDPEAKELLACFEEVKDIEAYRLAYDFAARLEKKFREALADDTDDEAVHTALLSATMAPAQIAGGHGIGYDRPSLCGNIANCKRALKNVKTCERCLNELEKNGALPSETAAALRQENATVARSLERWIENLRSRVCWR